MDLRPKASDGEERITASLRDIDEKLTRFSHEVKDTLKQVDNSEELAGLIRDTHKHTISSFHRTLTVHMQAFTLKLCYLFLVLYVLQLSHMYIMK